MSPQALVRSAAVAAVGTLSLLAAPAAAAPNVVVADGMFNPRGIDLGRQGRLLVAESGAGVITEIQTKGPGAPTKSTFADLHPVMPPGTGPVDVATRRHRAYVLVSTLEDPMGGSGNGLLVRILPNGQPSVVADIGAYQKTDPDPFDLPNEVEPPDQTNPYGLALLRGGDILVADAANNDLLLVDDDGEIDTVARFPTLTVPWPAGLPIPGPPPGTPVQVESVPTAVAVGPDGAWYVSELTGFPFTKAAARIWRVEPGTEDFNCDATATSGPCRVVATGFTNVIDLAFDDDGTMYVLEVAKESLVAVDFFGAPPIGALWAIENGSRTELVPGSLLFPGGVAVADERVYVTTGGVFGPGAGTVVRIDVEEDDGDEGRGDDDSDGGDDDSESGGGD
jgi:hypothetical protein